MTARTLVADAGNVVRAIKRWAIVDSGNVTRFAKRVFYIDASNVARMIFQYASVFTLGPSNFGGQSGYVQGAGGTLTPLSGGAQGLLADGNVVVQLDASNTTPFNMILVINKGAGPAISASSYLKSITIDSVSGGSSTFLASAASFTANSGDGSWSWPSGIKLNVGVAYTITVLLS